jgi:hypothetical protein
LIQVDRGEREDAKRGEEEEDLMLTNVFMYDLKLL